MGRESTQVHRVFLSVFTAGLFAGHLPAQEAITNSVAITNAPVPVIELDARSGVCLPPFIVTSEYLYQPIGTSLPASGRAAYEFSLPKDGEYGIVMEVEATNSAANSLYVNIDAEPQDPQMVWEIPLTIGFENRSVFWPEAGTGQTGSAKPKYFHLDAGRHELVIRGREPGVKVRTIYVVPRPHPVSNLSVKAVSQ